LALAPFIASVLLAYGDLFLLYLIIYPIRALYTLDSKKKD
jgi:hypothetical protein